MSIHATVTAIDLRITRSQGKKLYLKLLEEEVVPEKFASFVEYLNESYFQYESHKNEIVITDIELDTLNEQFYNLLVLFSPYIKDGSFVRFEDDYGGWAAAIFENCKLSVFGSLAVFSQSDNKKEIEEVGLGDHLTEIYGREATEEKLTDYRYWRYGCTEIAVWIEIIARNIGSLKSVNDRKIDTILSASTRAYNIVSGYESLNKGNVNIFGENIDYLLQHLPEQIEKINIRLGKGVPK